MDQCNRRENQKGDPYKDSQPIFDKGTKAKHGAKTVFSTNDACITAHPLEKHESRLRT